MAFNNYAFCLSKCKLKTMLFLQIYPHTLGKEITFAVTNVFAEFSSHDMMFQMSASVFFSPIYREERFSFFYHLYYYTLLSGRLISVFQKNILPLSSGCKWHFCLEDEAVCPSKSLVSTCHPVLGIITQKNTI